MNDLQKRIIKMAVLVFQVVKPLRKDLYLESAVKQILKSSTSVGANYSEAQSTGTYKDFYNKIKIAQKKLKETQYWITYLGNICDDQIQTKALEQEIEELLRIFATITKKVNIKLKTQKNQKTTIFDLNSSILSLKSYV